MRFTQPKLSCGRPYINHKACKRNWRGQVTSPRKKKPCQQSGKRWKHIHHSIQAAATLPRQRWLTLLPQACGQGLTLVILLAGHHTCSERKATQKGGVCMCYEPAVSCSGGSFLKQAVQTSTTHSCSSSPC